MDLVDGIGVPSRRARVADGRVAEVLAGVAVRVGQRGPVVLADRMGLDEDEVPVRFGVVGRPERQVWVRSCADAGEIDRARQALVGDVRSVRVDVVAAGVRAERPRHAGLPRRERVAGELWEVVWLEQAGRGEERLGRAT